MKKLILLTAVLIISLSVEAQWKPAGDKIKTIWGENLDPNNVLPEYPRPLMVRQKWQNLNGLWDFALLKKGEPYKKQGQILVPFAVESSLSGIGKRVSEDDAIYYQRTFTVPSTWSKDRLLLHFGAIDWSAEVWVNDSKVGSHTGGFTAFNFDITDVVKPGVNSVMVRVEDSTDGYLPRGKQRKEPEGIWYTPVSGIWQTVWLEAVPQNYIKDIKITPDIDNNTLTIDVLSSDCNNRSVINVYDGSNIVASGKGGKSVTINMPQGVKLWSPDSPFLYDLQIAIEKDGKQLDKVDSYAAMRKISMKRDERGIMRMQLNNKDLFQFGPLDQGWWPDGLYTAPTDEALLYDIVKTKEWGFNMIRKHIKVEPQRWYTHCDRVGMLVWQDMPSPEIELAGTEWEQDRYVLQEPARDGVSLANFKKEWTEIMNMLYSYPSIVMWVPFNENWGQSNTLEITQLTKALDPTRLVNAASGGNHIMDCGDVLDIHHYSAPGLRMYDINRVNVLGEYGGIGLAIEGHMWQNKDNWGYVEYKTKDDVTKRYMEYLDILSDYIKTAYSAAIYTQTTDVEGETNGFMTYDRKVIKMNEKQIKEGNQRICNSLNK